MTARQAQRIGIPSLAGLVGLLLGALGLWAIPKAMGHTEGSQEQRVTHLEKRVDGIEVRMEHRFNRVDDKLDRLLERSGARP